MSETKFPSEVCSMHFLVVDDFESMRTMLSTHLKSLGVTKISAVSSGEEGYKFLLSKQPTDDSVKFVITDLMMENGTGIDLIKMVREDPTLKEIPILMVTSKSEMNYVLEAAKLGVDGYLIKPWQISDLHKKIYETMKKKKLI